MKVLDLFAGLEGWSKPFRDRGHEVFTTDIDPRFESDLIGDILDVRPEDFPWKPDLVLASPPCETFSVASIGAHWTGGSRAYVPKTEAAATGIRLVQRTRWLIRELGAPYIIENPRGVLRNLGIFEFRPVTVWYCHYGERHAKPTDIWRSFDVWKPRPECHNRRTGHPNDCCCRDHDAASRGAKTGTQGIAGAAERAVIPYELALDVCLTAEQYLT